MPAQDYNHPDRARNLGDLDAEQWHLLSLDKFEALAKATDVDTFKTLLELTEISFARFRDVFRVISKGDDKISPGHFNILLRVLKDKDCLIDVLKNYTHTSTAVMWLIYNDHCFNNFLNLVTSNELSELLQTDLGDSRFVLYNSSLLHWLNCLLSDPRRLIKHHYCTQATIIAAVEKLNEEVLSDACKKGSMWWAYWDFPRIFEVLLKKVNAEALEYFYLNTLWCFGNLDSDNNQEYDRQEISSILVDKLQEKTLSEYPPNPPSYLDNEHLQKLLDKAPLLFLKTEELVDAALTDRINSMRAAQNSTEEFIQRFEQQAFFTQNPEIAIRKNPKEFLEFLDKHIIPRLKQKNILYIETWLEIISKALQAIDKDLGMQAQRDHLLALKGALLLFANKGNSDEAWDILKDIRSAENIPSTLCDDIGTRFLSAGNHNVSQGNLFEGRVQQLKSMDFMRVAASNHPESKEVIQAMTPAVRLNEFLSTYVEINDDTKINPDKFDDGKIALQKEISELGKGLFAEGMQRFDEYMQKRRHESQKYRFVFFAADTDLVTREFIYGTLSNKASSWEDKIKTIQAEINSGTLRNGWFSHRCEDILRELLDIAININKNIPPERRETHASARL